MIRNVIFLFLFFTLITLGQYQGDAPNSNLVSGLSQLFTAEGTGVASSSSV